MHTVEKIGGTSMSDYSSVRDNIFLNPNLSTPYNRIFVVSAYAGVTNKLLEHKKSAQPGVYSLFSDSMVDSNWQEQFQQLSISLQEINKRLFTDPTQLASANSFIEERLADARNCLLNLQKLCQHGHFSLTSHLETVKEMLASIGEAHSAWNTTLLLKNSGVNAVFVDLTGWRSTSHMSLDERVERAFKDIDLSTSLPIVTGYAHSETGLMSTFNRGYSEMTFSRIAVLTDATEAIIHKEFHLSSADPNLVGEKSAVPIGRTNYDVADQLANLGMEAIHPKAAKGLRQSQIPLRVKNTFQPKHLGTLITGDYVSKSPCVEIIAGCKGIYALEVFDQAMAGNIHNYDQVILKTVQRFKAYIVSKDVNANTITHYLKASLKTIKRICDAIQSEFAEAEINQKKVAIISAIGSDMQIPGLLSKAVNALAKQKISVLSIHQAMRQVDIQFFVEESDYDDAVRGLHAELIEVHDHGDAICIAS
ncbi:aspartate kinase [Thalassotalea sediminis]|uniref:aspartate kinase n=1 Tax=Thalassotalea sediminis TaxID=1759089 RepID=UPI002573C821|nr:aspartate kinase [Thalassotalea sediminis]